MRSAMIDSEGSRRSWQSIPISIAAGALIIAFAAIGVALLRPAPVRLSTIARVIETRSSRSNVSKEETPPSATTVRGAATEPLAVQRDLAGPLRAARDELKSGKYAEAIASLEAVDGSQRKSAYAQHVIDVLLEYGYSKTRNYPGAARVIAAQLSDGFLTPSEVEKKTALAARLNYVLKNYDAAIEFGSRVLNAEPTNRDMYTLVGQAYYVKGDWSAAASFEEGVVNRQVETGETPDDRSLRLLLSACLKLGSRDCEVHALEKLVAYYPSPTYQRELEALRVHTGDDHGF